MNDEIIHQYMEDIASSLRRIANSFETLINNSNAKQVIANPFPWDDFRVYVQMRSPLNWKIPMPATLEGMIGIGRKRMLFGDVIKNRPDRTVNVLDAIFNDLGMSEEWLYS